ncbi:hypothetical protein E7T09_00385 [Deinococcus sp. KSM4-11]|uniref:hypothetical protein n=1 Tax=Deinococcus sp. KSM4-11 TaxID=2568654 RepID=UPI0010A35106|nr:hypothetical protein [Deinococcus sp. KSM4-11]THF87740.1 hypothetical protein E7T09_00385 [Deinococcus sp. KSM4-11]
MKPLVGMMVGLTLLLTACPATPLPAPANTLDVILGGVVSAPVVISDALTDAVLFDGTIENSRTFGNFKAGTVVRVDGRPVTGYDAPAVHYVNVTAKSTVTLTYKQSASPSPLPHIPTGNVRGTVRLALGTPPVGADSDAIGKTIFYGYSTRGGYEVSIGSVDSQLKFDMILSEDPAIASDSMGTVVDSMTRGCTITVRTISDPAARISPLGNGNDGSFSLYSSNPTIELPLHAVVSETNRTPVELVYADRPVTTTLAAQCGTGALNLDLRLNQGWNVVEHAAGQGVGGQVNLKSSAVSPLDLLLTP